MSSTTPSSPSKSMAEAPITISAVLNALHEHLQTQTQLLPTLHAQLGLPPSALTDELSALQQKLAETVEKQIEGRREEVEIWMKKCDDIERDCLRRNKALGANSKSIGASVGELRKQQVLPVRYEMLNQYQEKLNQLYHTKLEQLTNLTNRFSSLTRVLGPDFFPPDITEIPASQGENSMDAMALRDVTPERFLRLEKELSRGKAEINRRLALLSTTFHQMDWLYDELDVQPPSCEDPLSSTLPSLHNNMASTSSDDPFLSNSTSTPTPASRGTSRRNPIELKSTIHNTNTEYARIFALFTIRVSEAEEAGNTVEPGSLIGVEGVEPSVGLLKWAEQTKAELEDIKRRREAQIQAMYDQLENLWRRLGVPNEAMDGFVENNRGSSEEVVQAYEQELERMLELKRESMGVFIANARAEIEKLWDELMVGEEERTDFTYFTEEEHSEELLTIHEEEIRKLKEERKIKVSLLASIKKYFEICEEEKELAAASMDQTRLLGRGPRDPGRLLREEKMRKRVQREKPKLEQDLLRTIPAWEEEHGRPFLVHGASIVEILMERANATADKENSKKKAGPGGRAGSVPSRSVTPGTGVAGSGSNPNARHTRSVSASGGSVTPAIRPASAMSNSSSSGGMQTGPNKRQRTMSQSAVKTRPDTQHASTRKAAPLGVSTSTARRQNQSQVQMSSYDGSSDTEWGVRSSVQRGGGKTPSTSSSLPSRTRAAASTGGKGFQTLSRSAGVATTNSSSKSASRGGYGTSLGLGHHSSTQPHRTVSGPAHTSSYSTLKTQPLSQAALAAAKRSARASRRESFRPRPSMDMDGPALLGISMSASRYAGFSGSPVREEED